MLKKIRLKKLIVWNVFFLIMIILFMLGYTNRKKKYDFEYIASPEFAHYIENEAAPDEIKAIAISRSESFFLLHEAHYEFCQYMLFFISINCILLVTENLKQRPRKPENV